MSTAATVKMSQNTGGAATLTAGSKNYVNPGAIVTVALLSSSGIKRWILREDGTDYLGEKGFVYQADLGGTFSVTFTLPQTPCVIPLVSSTWDGGVEVRESVSLQCYPNAIGQYHRVAAVGTSNVNVANVSVSVDSATLTAGEYVLFVGQTTGAENGIYTVGTVTAGYAPCTRAPDMPAGAALPSPQLVEVEKGTVYGGSTWKTSNTGTLTVATTTMTFYPRNEKGSGNMASNTLNVTSKWVQTGAVAFGNFTNVVGALQCAAPVAGAGAGYCVFTGGNAGGTGAFVYEIKNWG